QTGGTGAFYSLNPRVDSFLERYTVVNGKINFFRMGGIKRGGSSCYCRENTFLHALVANLFLESKDVVVMDMGAGIEHLTRGTVKGVDLIVVVTEPTRASVNTAQTVIGLAQDLGVQRLGVVANKIRNDREKAFIHHLFPTGKVLGTIPFDERLMEAAMGIGGDTVPEIEAALDEVYSQVITYVGV
ncbi:MAG: AAA family ATPase, partial [Heliobacteriaceae bacterium]|nr:AAA family ATPase [Heliobacteriaceae bacterium]